MSVLHHVVLISFGTNVSEATRQKIYDMYQSLGSDCGGKEAGVLFFHVGKNLDTRKNIHLVEVAMYRDNAALQAFRVHPNHKMLTDILCADPDTKWWVGDSIGPYPAPWGI